MTEAAPPEAQIKANKEAAIGEMVAAIIESLTNKPEEWRFDSGMGDGYATHVSEVIVAIDGSKIIRPALSQEMSVRAMNNLCAAIDTARAKQATLALTTNTFPKL